MHSFQLATLSFTFWLSALTCRHIIPISLWIGWEDTEWLKSTVDKSLVKPFDKNVGLGLG